MINLQSRYYGADRLAYSLDTPSSLRTRWLNIVLGSRFSHGQRATFIRGNFAVPV
jgi:hypothetical protein